MVPIAVRWWGVHAATVRIFFVCGIFFHEAPALFAAWTPLTNKGPWLRHCEPPGMRRAQRRLIRDQAP